MARVHDGDRVVQLADLAREGDQCAAADLFKEFGLVAVPEKGQLLYYATGRGCPCAE